MSISKEQGQTKLVQAVWLMVTTKMTKKICWLIYSSRGEHERSKKQCPSNVAKRPFRPKYLTTSTLSSRTQIWSIQGLQTKVNKTCKLHRHSDDWERRSKISQLCTKSLRWWTGWICWVSGTTTWIWTTKITRLMMKVIPALKYCCPRKDAISAAQLKMKRSWLSMTALPITNHRNQLCRNNKKNNNHSNLATLANDSNRL